MSNPFLEIENPQEWGPGSFHMALPLVRASRIEPGMRVLEVGAGSGQIATTLAKYFDVTVFTLEPWFGGEHVQMRAADLGVWDRVVALRTKAQELPFADGTFHAVISIGSFEMIGDERPQALAEMVRVARPGAYVGVAEPMCLARTIPPEVAELDKAGSHGFEHHFRSVEWTAKLFEDAGLKVTQRIYFLDAWKWWIEYSPRTKEAERALIKLDGGRWLSLGMVVGEKPA